MDPLLNDIDLTNSYPYYFVVKHRTIVIAHSETTLTTWIALLKTIWNSMELKRIIMNTTSNLLEKETMCANDELYQRGDILMPFTMNNPNDIFRREILHMIRINEYTISISIRWDNSDRVFHYKNY